MYLEQKVLLRRHLKICWQLKRVHSLLCEICEVVGGLSRLTRFLKRRSDVTRIETIILQLKPHQINFTKRYFLRKSSVFKNYSITC